MSIAVSRRWAVLGPLCAVLSACGSSGSSSPPPDVTLSGTVTFDLVPAVAGTGLDYAGTRASPARGVTVQLVGGGTVLASTSTDDTGRYSFTAAPSADVRVRVRAEMLRTGGPTWDFRVADNTEGNAIYALEGSVFNTGTSNVTRDVHAPSGWGGASYTAPRSAAPFAILDVVHDAVELVLSAEPAAQFPPLQIHWSPLNIPVFAEDGAPDPDTGEIGTSFFFPAAGLFLLGADGDDTDEYDRHVIAHEWGHYYEEVFSRSDSIGGPHTRGDHLDARVAFSEGWGNAFSAWVTDDATYVDTHGPGQAFAFRVEVAGAPPGSPNPNPGWYSEESIQEILYHIAAGDLGLGFAPIHAVLESEQRETEALTTLFPFIHALKEARADDAAAIDALVNAQSIDTIVDAYGSDETNAGDPAGPDVLPLFAELAVNQPAVNVCSTDFHRSAGTDSINKLGSRRFLRFTIESFGTYTIAATTTSMPQGESADPDLVLHRRGPQEVSWEAPSPACQAGLDPAECFERFTRALGPGNYVLEVYEWTNTNSHDDEEGSRPIGRTCFDVEVTLP